MNNDLTYGIAKPTIDLTVSMSRRGNDVADLDLV